MDLLGKLQCFLICTFPTGYYNPKKKDGLSLLSSHDSQSSPPFFFILAHLSLMFSTLSFSGRTIGEQPKIKQNHYNPNKQTQIRYPRLFLLLPSASVSLSLSILSPPSRILVRLLPPPRDGPGPLWVQSLKRAFAGSWPPAAMHFLSNLFVVANQLSRPSQASSCSSLSFDSSI